MAKPEEPCYRHELKYVIDPLQSEVLQRKLASVLHKDSHMESNGCYHTRTLYFDDYRNSALHEKLAGVYRRKKYRIRIYNRDDSLIKFEKKSKINNYSFKEVAKLSRGEAERVISGDIGFLRGSTNRLLREFYIESRCRLMRPVVVVEYERVAYVHPVGKVRVTFDTGLRAGLGQAAFFADDIVTMPAADASSVILEIKYNEVIPQVVRGLFSDTIRPRTAVSKYALCRVCDIRYTGGVVNLPRCICVPELPDQADLTLLRCIS